MRTKIEFLFQKYLQEIGYFQEFPLTRINHHDSSKEFDSPKFRTKQGEEQEDKDENINMIINDEELLRQNWKNKILVIIPTRLGLNKVNKEYFSAIQYVF